MSKSDVTFTFKLKESKELLEARGLPTNGVYTGVGSGSRAQQILDSEVMRHMSPYMPLYRGAMIDSMITDTKIGSGEVVVNTPYAKRRLKWARNNGLRGPGYFERMKADRLDDLKRVVEKVTGGSF